MSQMSDFSNWRLKQGNEGKDYGDFLGSTGATASGGFQNSGTIDPNAAAYGQIQQTAGDVNTRNTQQYAQRYQDWAAGKGPAADSPDYATALQQFTADRDPNSPDHGYQVGTGGAQGYANRGGRSLDEVGINYNPLNKPVAPGLGPAAQNISSSPLEGLQSAAPGRMPAIQAAPGGANPVNPQINPGAPTSISSIPNGGLPGSQNPPDPRGQNLGPNGVIGSAPNEGILTANGPRGPLPAQPPGPIEGLQAAGPAAQGQPGQVGQPQNTSQPPPSAQPAQSAAPNPTQPSSLPKAPTFSQTQAAIQATPTWQGNGGKMVEPPPPQPSHPSLEGLRGAADGGSNGEMGVKPPSRGLRQQPRPLY